MLWDIIRDFFVQYIFGGVNSAGDNFGGLIGFLYDIEGGVCYTAYTDYTAFNINLVDTQQEVNFSHISIGDWLSTTATIIVLIGICLAIWHFVRWLFRLTAGLIRG